MWLGHFHQRWGGVFRRKFRQILCFGGFVGSELRLNNILGFCSWKLCCVWNGLGSCLVLCTISYVFASGWVDSCLDGWVDSRLGGFVGSELRLNMFSVFAIGNAVVAGMGLAHVWFCALFSYVLALGWVKRCLEGWVGSLFDLFLLGQSCG